MRNNLSMLTYELAEIIAAAYREESDPITVIVAHAYLFTNLNMNAIRQILTVSDSLGTLRTPSKELVRRMISSMVERIRRIATERYGSRALDYLISCYDNGSAERLTSIINQLEATESDDDSEVE